MIPARVTEAIIDEYEEYGSVGPESVSYKVISQVPGLKVTESGTMTTIGGKVIIPPDEWNPSDDAYFVKIKEMSFTDTAGDETTLYKLHIVIDKKESNYGR